MLASTKWHNFPLSSSVLFPLVNWQTTAEPSISACWKIFARRDICAHKLHLHFAYKFKSRNFCSSWPTKIFSLELADLGMCFLTWKNAYESGAETQFLLKLNLFCFDPMSLVKMDNGKSRTWRESSVSIWCCFAQTISRLLSTRQSSSFKKINWLYKTVTDGNLKNTWRVEQYKAFMKSKCWLWSWPCTV